MNDKLFQSHIRQLAEQAVPDDVDLWPAIHNQLSITHKAGTATNAHNSHRRIRTLAIPTLVILLLLVLFFVTPWGQALAQSMFRFFSAAPAESFPLPTEQIQAYTEPTTPATFAAQLQLVDPTSIAPGETATPAPPAFKAPDISGCEEAQASFTYRCQVSSAEAAVGFNLKEPPGDLKGLVFSRAYANPTLHITTLSYTAIGGGSELTISQARGDMPGFRWDEVPPSAAVERVKVGEYDGEYVHGMYVVKGGSKSATWLAGAPEQRLRWREGGMLFEIRVDGNVERVEYLDKNTMVTLAESLVFEPNTTEGQLRADYLTSVKDAETLAGFDLLEPMTLPKGFSFKYAQYDVATERVTLVYEPGSGSGNAGIYIYLMPLYVSPETNYSGNLPPEAVETVRIGEFKAIYTSGAYYAEYYIPTPGVPTPTPIWKPDDPTLTLTWRTNNMNIQILFFASQWYGGRLEKADMIAIAESMK